MIDKAIAEERLLNIKEGNIIKDGYHEEVMVKKAKTEGKDWLMEMETKKEATGIKNRIKYNQYLFYLGVTKSYRTLFLKAGFNKPWPILSVIQHQN